MQTVPHVLSHYDSMKAQELARHIHERAESTNRQIISRYGMDIFQDVKPSLDLKFDFLLILYRIPAFIDYVAPFEADYQRFTAFENAVALNVHKLTVQCGLPVVVLELSHG